MKCRDQLAQLIPEIMGTIAERLEEPYFVEMANALVRIGYETESELEELRNSALARKVSDLVRNGSPKQRLKLADLAFFAFSRRPRDIAVLSKRPFESRTQ